MNWRGPERLGDLKSSWYQAVPEVGTVGYTQEVNRIFEEDHGGISAEQVQALFILKALAGTEKKRAHMRMNKLWEEGKIDLDESGRMRIEESNIPYPILSYEQLRSKIPAKVRTMKKADSEMKTEEELVAEGYTLVFEEPYQGTIDRYGTWRDSEGRRANTSKRVITSLPWEHTLEDLIDEEYIKEF